MRVEWKDLVEFVNLCDAGPLASVIFCCKLSKRCPFRDKALEILGISKEKYEEVKERLKIRAKGTCFGNLAYCCSLNVQCEDRDDALKRLGMTPADYLKYKYKILLELIPEDKLKLALSERVVHAYAVDMININNMDEGYRGIMLGNPNLSDNMLILNIVPMKTEVNTLVKETFRKDKFISVRVSSDVYNKLVELAKINGCSISDIVREAIAMYLSLR